MRVGQECSSIGQVVALGLLLGLDDAQVGVHHLELGDELVVGRPDGLDARLHLGDLGPHRVEVGADDPQLAARLGDLGGQGRLQRVERGDALLLLGDLALELLLAGLGVGQLVGLGARGVGRHAGHGHGQHEEHRQRRQAPADGATDRTAGPAGPTVRVRAGDVAVVLPTRAAGHQRGDVIVRADSVGSRRAGGLARDGYARRWVHVPRRALPQDDTSKNRLRGILPRQSRPSRRAGRVTRWSYPAPGPCRPPAQLPQGATFRQLGTMSLTACVPLEP